MELPVQKERAPRLAPSQACTKTFSAGQHELAQPGRHQLDPPGHAKRRWQLLEALASLILESLSSELLLVLGC